MTLARIAFPAALLGLLTAVPASAQPLDLWDPTPRPIQVEFEISVAPGAIAQTHSEPFGATYSATGNTGTVVISGAVYEAAIETHALDYFDTMMVWSLVSGTASDFELDIDLTTLEATLRSHSYQVLITDPVPFPQNGTITRELSTTATAGFAFLPQFPGFPFFCDTCTLVPGAPYDPVTGTINAVGSDHLVAPDIPSLIGFSRAGDLRLSEGAPPGVPAFPTGMFWVLTAALACAACAMLCRVRSRGVLVAKGR